MIHVLAAAVFLSMAILFVGIAVVSGITLAWVFAVLNGALSALNLIVHLEREETRRE